MEKLKQLLLSLVMSVGVLVLFFAFTSSAKADSLVVTGFAWHAAAHDRGAQDSNYNEVNPGLGYEHVINDDVTIALGYYQNSYYRHSNYLLYQWQPLHYDTSKYGNWKLGLSMGQVTGYTTRTINPVILPTLTYQYERVGFNIGFLPVPPINQRGIAAIQFKLSFGK